jgi:hypothetical protein
MTIFFIWEILLTFGVYYLLKTTIQKGLAYREKEDVKGVAFLLKSRNPLIKLFRWSLLWVILLPAGVYFLLIPNEIFIYGMLAGVLLWSFLLLPPKNQHLPFAKELPFVLALFGFTPWIMSVLFLLNLAIPITTFSKTYPVNELKIYSNPSETYWIKPEDELYKTTKVLLKIPQKELSVNHIEVTYQYGICGLIRIKAIRYE